jgi:signal transduction histidine kinase/HAMP domain-containing protein
MFRNLQIGTRLTLIVTATVIVILTVVTFFEINTSDTALRNQTVTRFSTKSSEVINLINQEFQRIQTSVRLFASAIGNMGDPNVSNELRQTVANYVASDTDELATRFSVLRPDGKVGVLTLANPLVPDAYEWRVYSFTNDIPNRNDPLEGRFYTPFATEQAAWFLQQETFYDEERQPSITIVAPFRQNNVIVGLVWIDIPRDQFQREITQLLNDEGLLADTNSGYAALVDETGNLITVHNLSVRNYALEPAVQSALQILRDTGVNEVAERVDPITQQESFMNVRTFTANNWKFLTILPESEIPVLPSGVLGPVFIISSIGVMILIFVINYFTRNAVAEPLQRLGNSAQEIGAGDFRYFIPHRERSDEIGRLADELENMRVSLETSYDELSRWGRTLERRVVERTKELDVARESAQTSANELTAIYGESLVVVNESQLKPILDALTGRIPALLRSTYSAVWLLNDERDRLQLVATNNPAQREGTVIQVGEGVAGQAVQQATPLLLDDYKAYEHSLTLPGFGSDAPFDRAMAVPLIYVGRPIGVIVVGRPAEAPSYTESDQRLLSLFANLVSPSVRNAQLFVRMNQAIDEAERANQVKTRFLASVTHELRTPLNLVINNMDFMRIGAFGAVNKEQHERLGQTVRSAEHLLYLINDLLDVSKIEAGEMQLFIQENDIATMLDDSIDNAVSFIDKIEGKADAVEFVVDLDEDLPKIPMDVRRIRQVLTNLLTNAIKFTEQGTVSLTVRRQNEGVEFAVSDTGMGIAPEEADKLFQAFERTDSAKASMIEGTGLGLPISRYLVEQHGGELTFTSVVGEGTTFRFTLPYTQLTVTDSQIIKRSDPNIAAMLASKTQ